MEEVVVTGYGTFKKSAYAGSASTVKADKMKDIPAVSFKDLLQGNAPGVQFSSSSGQPGASSSLNIRGMGSFNASNSPLYVIDGIPMRSGSINTMSSDAGLDIMSTINSSDIENITIIKDAAAASLYGSRAANGVVLITTKKGKSGKPQISFKADWGSSDFAMDYRPVMGGEERREYIYNGLVAGALRDGNSHDEAIAYANENIDDYAPVPWCGYVDWDDIMFKKGNHQTYEASISGGTDKFKYYSSISYLKQEGIAMKLNLALLNACVVSACMLFTTQTMAEHPYMNDPVLRRFFEFHGAPSEEQGNTNLGSGVIVSEDGYIVTNAHVTKAAESAGADAPALVVQVRSGASAWTLRQARVLENNQEQDLALLQIDGPAVAALAIGASGTQRYDKSHLCSHPFTDITLCSQSSVQ